MDTLSSPVYEVRQDSEWYKSKVNQQKEIENFFDDFEKKFGFRKDFSFYHSEYFGVYGGTEAYEFFKDDLVKNPDKNNWYAFKKRSKHFKEIKELIEQIIKEELYPFKQHDVLGLNNISASQWVGDRWFFGVKYEKYIKDKEHKEIKPIDYKDYLNIVMEVLEKDKA